MSIIHINSQHRGNLDLTDIDNIKHQAKDGDTVKFGTIFGKTYHVIKSTSGEISLTQKQSKHALINFLKRADVAKSDIKLNRMNHQLQNKSNASNTRLLTITYNQANKATPEQAKSYFQNLVKAGDYDVVLFAEQESKLLAKTLQLDGMSLLSENKMKVMTKGLDEGISYTSLSVFAKDGIDVEISRESKYRHGWSGKNMKFLFGLTGNKGGVKTSLKINGQPLTAISAHLDSNKQAKRALEGDKLMAGIKPNEEVLITGDLNEREILLDDGTLFDPVSLGHTHLAKHGFDFKQLNSHTYMQLDETGKIKHKPGRDRPDFGELDNTGLTNKTGKLQDLQTRVIDEGFDNISDHKPVASTFVIKG